MNPLRPWRRARREDEREDVISKDGVIVFNYLQQREVDTSERTPSLLEEIGTTDPHGITTG